MGDKLVGLEELGYEVNPQPNPQYTRAEARGVTGELVNMGLAMPIYLPRLNGAIEDIRAWVAEAKNNNNLNPDALLRIRGSFADLIAWTSTFVDNIGGTGVQERGRLDERQYGLIGGYWDDSFFSNVYVLPYMIDEAQNGEEVIDAEFVDIVEWAIVKTEFIIRKCMRAEFIQTRFADYVNPGFSPAEIVSRAIGLYPDMEINIDGLSADKYYTEQQPVRTSLLLATYILLEEASARGASKVSLVSRVDESDNINIEFADDGEPIDTEAQLRLGPGKGLNLLQSLRLHPYVTTSEGNVTHIQIQLADMEM